MLHCNTISKCKMRRENLTSVSLSIHKNMFIKQLCLRYLTICFVSLVVATSASYAQRQPANVDVDVVMLGDSITQGGPWNALFPNAKILNRGVSGYSTHDLLREIKSTIELQPRKVFLMIGINDLLRGASVDETYGRYLTILDALQNAGIKVYIQATVECVRSQCGMTVDKVRALNEKLKQVTTTRGLTWIDLNPGLTSQTHGLLEKYTTDGLHLSANAYVYWAEKIKHLILNI